MGERRVLRFTNEEKRGALASASSCRRSDPQQWKQASNSAASTHGRPRSAALAHMPLGSAPRCTHTSAHAHTHERSHARRHAARARTHAAQERAAYFLKDDTRCWDWDRSKVQGARCRYYAAMVLVSVPFLVPAPACPRYPAACRACRDAPGGESHSKARARARASLAVQRIAAQLAACTCPTRPALTRVSSALRPLRRASHVLAIFPAGASRESRATGHGGHGLRLDE